MLGARAAEFLSASLGSQVQIGHATFHVIGMLKTANGFEDGGVFMPLASAQSFFHKQGTSSVITVKLRNKDDAAAFKSMIRAEVSEPDCAGRCGVHALLFAVQDSEGDGLGGGRLRIAARRAGRGEHDDHVGVHADSRDRDSARQRIFSGADWRRDLWRVGGGVCLRRAGWACWSGRASCIALKLIPALDGYVDPTIHPLLMLVVLVLALLTGVAGALYPAVYAMRIRAVEALRFE